MAVITPVEAEEFIDELPIKKFHGIGKVTEEKMNRLSIFKGNDLKKLTEEELSQSFGKMGHYYYNIARAIDNRAVTPDRIRKSIGAETTFEKDIDNEEEIIPHLKEIISILVARIKKANTFGKTVTLKIKYYDFILHTRSKTSFDYIYLESDLLRIAVDLLNNTEFPVKSVRLLGVSVSNLSNEETGNKPVQLSFNFL